MHFNRNWLIVCCCAIFFIKVDEDLNLLISFVVHYLFILIVEIDSKRITQSQQNLLIALYHLNQQLNCRRNVLAKVLVLWQFLV